MGIRRVLREDERRRSSGRGSKSRTGLYLDLARATHAGICYEDKERRRTMQTDRNGVAYMQTKYGTRHVTLPSPHHHARWLTRQD